MDLMIVTGADENNRAENFHPPNRKRERQMLSIKSPASAERFLTVHAAFYDAFYTQRHLVSRATLKRLRADAHATRGEAAA